MNINSITGFVTDVSSEVNNSAILAFFIGMILFILLINLGFYIYTSLAYMKLAKKTNIKPAWFAWLPVSSIYLLIKMAKADLWPIYLLISSIVVSFILILFAILFNSGVIIVLLIISLIISFICIMIFTVYWFIWHWKIYERVGGEGWWSLMILIPYAGGILYLVFLGIAAWSSNIPKENIDNSKNINKKEITLFTILGIISTIFIFCLLILFIGFMLFVISQVDLNQGTVVNGYTNFSSDASFYTISELNKLSNSGIYNTRGYLIKANVYCPPCPPTAVCSVCIPPALFLSEENISFANYTDKELRVDLDGYPGENKFEIGKMYEMTVEVKTGDPCSASELHCWNRNRFFTPLGIKESF